MTKHKHALLLSIALLTGCAVDRPGSTYTVYIDPAFGSNKTETILSCLDEWKTDVGTRHPLKFTPIVEDVNCDGTRDCYRLITIHPTTLNVLHSMRGASQYSIGITYRSWSDTLMDGNTDWSVIYVDNALSDYVWTETMKHEIGHALALKHTGPGSLMCKSTDCSPGFITAIDVHQYNDLRE